MNLRKKIAASLIVQATDEKALAQGMVAVLAKYEKDFGIVDEVAKLKAALVNPKNVMSVIEESLFYMDHYLALSGYQFGFIGNGKYRFVDSKSVIQRKDIVSYHKGAYAA